MHSSRMRTARSGSNHGRSPPRDQAPPGPDPPGPGTPLCEQISRQTLLKILTCPKLRLRSIKTEGDTYINS